MCDYVKLCFLKTQRHHYDDAFSISGVSINFYEKGNEFMSKTVCFTGKRPKYLCGYNREKYNRFVKQLSDIINTLYNQGFHRFVSGGAQGFDQLAFEAVSISKRRYNLSDIENVLYLPFESFGSQWPEKGAFGQHTLRCYKQMAYETRIVSDEPTTKSDAIWKLMTRNYAMVNDSDLIVALVPHTNPDNPGGGTEDCIKYATRSNKQVLLLEYKIVNTELIIACVRYKQNTKR